MMSTNILRYGKPEPLPKTYTLRAGALTLVYEAGDLRYIRLGDREIIRRLYVAVRDENWGTVAGALHSEQIEQNTDSFEIAYEAEHHQGDIRFVWRALIRGEASGHIAFEMKGEAKTSFLKNRIGFCVLHPLRECAGVDAMVERVDGSRQHTRFPLDVAPQLVVNGIVQPVQPFSEMRSVRYPVTSEVQVEVAFSGDTFEMEDQRNWIDASYKTYCTPLRLPWPAELKKGDIVKQSVNLTLHGALPKVALTESGSISVSISKERTALPKLGLSVASHGEMLSEREQARLRKLKLSHLRVDLNLAETYEAKLAQAVQQAEALDVRLELALVLSDQAEVELTALVKHLKNARILNVLIFHAAELSTSKRWLSLARQIFTTHGMTFPVYGGSNAYFAHINAEHPPVDVADGVVYSISPQVHAFDQVSIVETCEAVSATIQTARTFLEGKPLAISTVTLKPRYNPYDRSKRVAPPGELPPQVDVRQLSLFGAAWTLGALKYMAESGKPEYLTFYETTGWCGVMERESGSPLPQAFPSRAGAVFPMYHVFADVAEFVGGEVVRSSSSQPLKIESLVVREENKQRVLLCNMTDETHSVRLEQANAAYLLLDDSNVEEAMTTPETFRAGDLKEWTGKISLPPYALLRIDSQR